MADETIEFEERGASKVADGYRKVADAADDAGSKIGDSEKQSQQAEKTAGVLTKTLGRLADGYALVKEGIIGTFNEGAKLEASQGRLNSAMKRANFTAQEQRRVMRGVAKSVLDFGVEQNEANDLMQRFVATTNDATRAVELYGLAQDVAAQEGTIELSEATELLVNAQKGEVTELKKLAGFNEQLASELQKVASVEDRARIATELLTEKYEGLAEANAGTQDKLAATAAALRLARANGGRVLINLTQLVTKTAEATGAFDSGELSLNNFATAMGNFADETGDATSKLAAFVREAKVSEILSGAAKGAAAGSFAGPIGAIPGAVAGVVSTVPGVLDRVENKRARGQGRQSRAPAAGAQIVEGGQGPRAPAETLAQNEIARLLNQQNRPASGGGRDPNRGSGAIPQRSDEEIDAQIFGAIAERDQEEQRRKDLKALMEHRAELREQETEQFREELRKRQEAFATQLEQNQRLFEEAAKAREQMRKEETLAQVGDITESVTAATDGLSAIVENEKAALALQIGGAAARAALTWAYVATPPPIGGPQYLPGAIAQTAAVGQMVAEAAGSGGGAASKRPSTSSGAGASARGRGQGGSPAETSLASEGTRSARGGEAPAALVVQNFHTAFPPNPEQRKELARAVKMDARRNT